MLYNITFDSLPQFILEIINTIDDFSQDFDILLIELNEEWHGALNIIISHFNSRNVKDLAMYITDLLDSFIMYDDRMEKIHFFMFFINKIPSVNDKIRLLFMSEFLRYYGRQNPEFNELVDKFLEEDFFIKNAALAKDILREKKDYDCRKNQLKIGHLEDFVNQEIAEMYKKLEEYTEQNYDIVKRINNNNKEITSLKHEVVEVTKTQMQKVVKDDITILTKETKGELDSLLPELRSNSEKINILQKSKNDLVELNEKLTKKIKANKKTCETTMEKAEKLKIDIENYFEDAKNCFNQNYSDFTTIISMISKVDENFGNLSKDLDAIRLRLNHKDLRVAAKSPRMMKKLMTSKLEMRLKTPNIPGTTTPEKVNPEEPRGTSNQETRYGYAPDTKNEHNKDIIVVNYGNCEQKISSSNKIRNITNESETKQKISFSLKKSYAPSSQQINCIINISYGSTNQIAAGGTDNLIKLYNLENWEVDVSLTGHRDFISSLLFMNEFQPLLVSGSADRTIKIWKLYNNSCIQNLIAHSGPIYCLLYLGKSLFVSGSGDKSMKIWNIDNGTCFKRIQSHKENVTCLVSLTSRKKFTFASGSWDSTIKVWNFEFEDDEPENTLIGHESYVNCLIYLDKWDRDLLVSGSRDKTIKLWNLSVGKSINTSKGHDGPVTSLMSLNCAENSVIVSGSEDKTLRLWFLTSGDCIGVVKSDHTFGIKLVMKIEHGKNNKKTKEDKESFLTVGNDKIIKLWQLD